jgi:hypothetical protein
MRDQKQNITLSDDGEFDHEVPVEGFPPHVDDLNIIMESEEEDRKVDKQAQREFQREMWRRGLLPWDVRCKHCKTFAPAGSKQYCHTCGRWLVPKPFPGDELFLAAKSTPRVVIPADFNKRAVCGHCGMNTDFTRDYCIHCGHSIYYRPWHFRWWANSLILGWYTRKQEILPFIGFVIWVYLVLFVVLSILRK